MKTRLHLFGMSVLLIASFVWLVWYRGHSYRIKDATYSEASNVGVVKVFIPPQAQKITAWIRPGQMSIVASFDIREEEFVAWAKEKGWELKEVRNIWRNDISRVGNPNDRRVEIVDGWLYEWVYDAKDLDSTRRVFAYDRAIGTGYFSQ